MGETTLQKSAQYVVVRLIQYVCQDVEPPTMRHPDHDLPHFERRLQHDLVNQHHQRIQSLKTVPALAGERAMQVALKALGLA